jgi:hypothetical protein
MASNRFKIVVLTALLAFNVGCAGDGAGEKSAGDGGGRSARQCALPDGLERQDGVPIGVLMPAGSADRQSYTTMAEVAAAGLTAVSLGFEFFYTNDGRIVFDFDGSEGDEAKQRWLDSLKCNVIEAKESGLIVSVWGQFVEANRRGEPGEVPEEIRSPLLDGALELMPEIGAVLEELQVEYWTPVSELEKFVGLENHNRYFGKMVEAGRSSFSGLMYVQPNILQRDSFYVQGITPDLGGVDALGISWISYECEEERLGAADFFLEQAASQEVQRVFISEIGDTRASDEGARPCLESLIERWDGREKGVFVLDMPTTEPGGANIKGNWQEEVLQALLK